MSSPIVTRRTAQKAKIQTRAMVRQQSVEQRKPNEALQEAKRKAKLLKMQQQQQQQTQADLVVKDIFQNAMLAKSMQRKPTGLVYDERMTQHCCLWDDKHPESPQRFTRILERCKELQLVERCQIIESRRATKDEVMLLHAEDHYARLAETANVKDDERMEELSSRYDSIYIHPSTFELSLLAVGSTVDLIEGVSCGRIQNGMAIIRPPGHHAMKAEFNGYCFFNNVAIATQYALDILKLRKIMIIDWDVHHGQGTQRFFYDNPHVLYFSVHRFEHGTYWPNLKESDFDAIGTGEGRGYNFNVPLNRTGMGNGDYLAIFQQILLPVAVEYQPELIIVSAGFDAALGCPEGEMEVTPAFYAHLTSSLMKLADSRVAVVLEGGYCLDSLSEGAALTLRALLGDPCPMLVEKLQPPCAEIQETILNCIYAHRPYWKCLQVQPTYTLEEFNNENPRPNLHEVSRVFKGGPPLPERFPTRGTAPVIPPEKIEQNAQRLRFLKANTILNSPKIRVCYVYDELMLQHQNLFEEGHPEQPERIKRIYEMHQEYNLLASMQHLARREATTDEICLAHTRAHVNFVRRIGQKDELNALAANYNSVYFHPKTFECATTAAGSVLQVVDKVLRNEARSGVCIVRPPGHHAEPDVPHGFCIFNNVAIAAQYALREYGLRRVLIVDWDVHHGNGTQHIFESNPNVLYVSVHRYDEAAFFPKSKDGNFDAVGKGAGVGFNVNIPWNKKGMGDLEYVMAFQQLIMPIAYEFDPELVLISAGFDAAIGDPLGGCKVTPEAYGLFTHWLGSLANGRVIVCLEGGYNVNSIAYAMTMCTKSLLGEPIPSIQLNGSASRPPTVAYLSCLETIRNCLEVQQGHWKSLVFNKHLPEASRENNNEDFLCATMQNLDISPDECEGAVGGATAAQPELPDEPSGSKPKVKEKTLSEYLEELQGQEFFAIVPLRTCPHLSQLRPQTAPQKFVRQQSVDQRKPNEALQEAKRKAKLLKMQQQEQTQADLVVKDKFQNAMLAKLMQRKPTGLVYDERMSQHCCLWDDKHPESPQRFTRILERCKELQLVERCEIIESRRATKDEVLLLHSEDHYTRLAETANENDEEKLEEMSSRYASIYIHPSTFELSLLAVGSTVDLIEGVSCGRIQNGMAIIRPPGHHAMKAEFNGYCFFNNVAIATQYALDILKLRKIMIIDWDVHHGQGTQRFFYDNPRVLYFSVHRFEHGTYWPNLRESDFDAIGSGEGRGYNFNVPLNRIGMGNGDYLAIFQQILLPVAVEYQPELIIVSAGFDAALGCPDSKMELTPAFYAHLTSSLMKLADSRVAVVLEGGYCLDSLSEGVALTLRALLGDPCPMLVEKLQPPCAEIQEAILNCIYAHRPYWKCLQVQPSYKLEELNNENPRPNLHEIRQVFKGGPPRPERFRTRGTVPVIPPEKIEENAQRLRFLKANTILNTPKIRVCYVYDELMLQHQNLFEEGHPEQPERIKRIYEMHQEYNLLASMQHLASREATTDEICLAHSRAHVNFVRRIGQKDELNALAANYNSVYFHPKTFECATTAAGSVLQVVDKVLRNEARSGVCIVRPPGHHAEPDVPHGFCIFNNVAIAAQYALREYGLRRVLIVDWDVHHGNGTQHIFESNPNVLYVSVHRYDEAAFFPKSKDGNFDAVGKGAGVGFNVNIPWNKKGMGDLEYVMAFQQLIMPIAYEFDPELVLISAGFDAAIGDPLGGCKVTPEAYGLFTHWLGSLANGRVIVCLEGGYNVNSIAYAMTMCTKSLLGEPIPSIQLNGSASRPPTVAYLSCLETIRNCLEVQQGHWKSLVFNKHLPEASRENNNEDFLCATMQNLDISKDECEGAVGGATAAQPELHTKCIQNKNGSKK